MTIDKAIKILSGDIIVLNLHNSPALYNRNKAHEMAIQALEEIQQYRAIGTVEQLRFMKSVCDMSDDMLKSLADSIRARMKYEAIGTVEEFKALKEKNEPKKPNEISWGATSCPICSYEFGFGSRFKYCSKCGQKIDWQ